MSDAGATGMPANGFDEFRTPSMGMPQPAFDAEPDFDPPPPIRGDIHHDEVYTNHRDRARDRDRDVTWITTGSRLPSQYQRSHGQPSPYGHQPPSPYGHQFPGPYNMPPPPPAMYPAGPYIPQPPSGPYRPQPPVQYQGHYSQNAQAGPSRPLPTPIHDQYPVGTIPSEDLDEEYMAVGPDDYEEYAADAAVHGDDEVEEDLIPVPQPVYPIEKKKSGFVGGFVNGLRKLPRAITWQRKKGPQRVETLPIYQSDPDLPAVGVEDGAPVLYTEGMSMPAPINEAPSRAGSFTSHHSNPAQHDTEYSYNDGRSHAPPSTNNQSIGGPPAANPSSNGHGRQSTGGHSTTHSNAPYEPQINETHGPVTVSNHHETTPSIPPTSTNARGGGYSVHTPHTHPISRGVDSEAEESPVFIEPLPASDYDKMSPPHSVEGASLSTRVMRVGEFFQELYQLPWVGRHGVITADYVPTGGKGKPTTWYPGGVRNGDLHGRPDFDIDGTPEVKGNTSVRSREQNSGRGWRRDPSTYYSRDYDYRHERERERQREMDRDRERDRQRQRTRSPAYDERSSPPYDFYERTRSPPHERARSPPYEPPPRARTTAADYDQYRNRSPPGPYGYSNNDRPRHRDRDRDRQRDRERDRDHERDWERDRHRRHRDRDRERDRERDRGRDRERDRERGSDRPRYPNGYAPDHRDAQPLYIYPNPAHPNAPVLPGQPSVMSGEARPLYVIAPTPPRPSIPPPVSTGGKMDRGGSKSGEGRTRGERAGRDTKDGSEAEVEAPGGFHAYAMSRAPTNHDGRGAEPV